MRARHLWSDFGARNRAVGLLRQIPPRPGDRVAILCPQNLDYLISFWRFLYSGRIAVPIVQASEPGRRSSCTRCDCPVGDP